MFLDNYYKYLYCLHKDSEVSSSSSAKSTFTYPLVDSDGNEVTTLATHYNSLEQMRKIGWHIASSEGSSARGGFIFEMGKSDAPNTSKTYCLGEVIPKDQYSDISTTVTLSYNGDFKKNYTITVTSKETIVVKEIGLRMRVYTGSTDAYVLMYRKVLETPITLTAGVSKVIYLELEF